MSKCGTCSDVPRSDIIFPRVSARQNLAKLAGNHSRPKGSPTHPFYILLLLDPSSFSCSLVSICHRKALDTNASFVQPKALVGRLVFVIFFLSLEATIIHLPSLHGWFCSDFCLQDNLKALRAMYL